MKLIMQIPENKYIVNVTNPKGAPVLVVPEESFRCFNEELCNIPDGNFCTIIGDELITGLNYSYNYIVMELENKYFFSLAKFKN